MPSAIPIEKKERLPVTVDKPIPLEFDLGNLCAFDTNPLDPTSYAADLESCLSSAARDGAQALINQVLTAVPLHSTQEGVLAMLPDPSTALPREKPVPKPKAPTKWDLFAAKKGIAPKSRDAAKKVYDEATGEWVPKWGYKGKNKEGEDDWLVEIDEKKHKDKDGEEVDPRKLSRQERMERIKKNERQQKANEKRAAQAAKLAGTGGDRKRRKVK